MTGLGNSFHRQPHDELFLGLFVANDDATLTIKGFVIVVDRLDTVSIALIHSVVRKTGLPADLSFPCL